MVGINHKCFGDHITYVNYHIVGAHLFFFARATQRRHTSTEFYTLGCEFFRNKPEDRKHGDQLFDD